jgi:hypothetical protein
MNKIENIRKKLSDNLKNIIGEKLDIETINLIKKITIETLIVENAKNNKHTDISTISNLVFVTNDNGAININIEKFIEEFYL